MLVYTINLYTAGKLGLDALDITYATATTARALAPSGRLVLAIQKGKLTTGEYEKMYFETLDKAREAGLFEAIFSGKSIIYLGCYCRPDQFCHRNLLAKYLKIHFGATLCGEVTCRKDLDD